MGTIVFDFDSTLIPEESLERWIEARLEGDVELGRELAELTRQGMEGEIPFRASLEGRLALAAPRRGELVALGQELVTHGTAGAAELVDRLQAGGHEVWIVSGGFQEVLLPTGRALGLPEARIQGVRGRFGADDRFLGLADQPPFCESKVAGARPLAQDWPHPRIAVGDGMTDRALLTAGLVDHFIAYVEHVRRPAVLAHADPVANDMHELEDLLGDLL